MVELAGFKQSWRWLDSSNHGDGWIHVNCGDGWIHVNRVDDWIHVNCGDG